MRAREFIIEAAYDGIRDRLIRQHPDRAEFVNSEVNWAKQTLKKPDRVIWWLKIVEREITQGGQRLSQAHNMFNHLMAINYQPIQDYVFGNQGWVDVMNALTDLEDRYKQRTAKEQPVAMQAGDRVIQRWNNGMEWVFTDRAYCSDEGRSGRHCGNIVGKTETDQRIISLRSHGHVRLTFILLPDGKLGEMKGVGNAKPAVEFHPYIVWLLKQPFIKGIKGGGYALTKNFSIYDLGANSIAELEQARPDLLNWGTYHATIGNRTGKDAKMHRYLSARNGKWIKPMIEAVNAYMVPALMAGADQVYRETEVYDQDDESARDYYYQEAKEQIEGFDFSTLGHVIEKMIAEGDADGDDGLDDVDRGVAGDDNDDTDFETSTKTITAMPQILEYYIELMTELDGVLAETDVSIRRTLRSIKFEDTGDGWSVTTPLGTTTGAYKS